MMRFFDRRTGETIAALPGDGTLRVYYLARAFDGVRVGPMMRHFGVQEFGGEETISIPLDVPVSVPGGLGWVIRRVAGGKQSVGSQVTVLVARDRPSYQLRTGYSVVPQRVTVTPPKAVTAFG